MGGCLAVLIFSVSGLKASVVLSEGFNNVNGLSSSGRVLQNNSSPLGSTGWFQGNIGIDTLTVEAGATAIPEPSGLWLSVAPGLAAVV